MCNEVKGWQVGYLVAGCNGMEGHICGPVWPVKELQSYIED